MVATHTMYSAADIEAAEAALVAIHGLIESNCAEYKAALHELTDTVFGAQTAAATEDFMVKCAHLEAEMSEIVLQTKANVLASHEVALAADAAAGAATM